MLINIPCWFLSGGKLYLRRLQERKRNLNTWWWKYWWQQCNLQIWHNVILENEFAGRSLLFQGFSELAWLCAHAWRFTVKQNALWSSSTSALICFLHVCKQIFTLTRSQPGSREVQESSGQVRFYGQALRLGMIRQKPEMRQDYGVLIGRNQNTGSNLRTHLPVFLKHSWPLHGLGWEMNTGMQHIRGYIISEDTSCQRVVSRIEAKAKAVDGTMYVLKVYQRRKKHFLGYLRLI